MDGLIAQRFGSRERARCEDRQCKSPWRRGIRIFGDHIKERRDGGAEFDPANIQCLCGSCHTRKTAEARAARYGLGTRQGG